MAGLESGVLKNVVAATSEIYLSSESLFKAINESCCSLDFDIFLLGCHKATRYELVMDLTFTTIPVHFSKIVSRSTGSMMTSTSCPWSIEPIEYF